LPFGWIFSSDMESPFNGVKALLTAPAWLPVESRTSASFERRSGVELGVPARAGGRPLLGSGARIRRPLAVLLERRFEHLRVRTAGRMRLSGCSKGRADLSRRRQRLRLVRVWRRFGRKRRLERQRRQLGNRRLVRERRNVRRIGLLGHRRNDIRRRLVPARFGDQHHGRFLRRRRAELRGGRDVHAREERRGPLANGVRRVRQRYQAACRDLHIASRVRRRAPLHTRKMHAPMLPRARRRALRLGRQVRSRDQLRDGSRKAQRLHVLATLYTMGERLPARSRERLPHRLGERILVHVRELRSGRRVDARAALYVPQRLRRLAALHLHERRREHRHLPLALQGEQHGRAGLRNDRRAARTGRLRVRRNLSRVQ